MIEDIWRDHSGYFYGTKVDGSEPYKFDITYKSNRIVPTFQIGKICFLNCGGTVVSTPTYQRFTGVQPLKDLNQKCTYLQEFFRRNNVTYDQHKLKLSEDWTLSDYLDLHQKIRCISASHKNLILTHGTDNVSFFAPYVDLLAKKYNFKAVIIVSQRSLDRPTSELPLLLQFAPRIFKKISSCAVVCTYHSWNQVKIHSCYQIKKVHVTRKNGFYSENEIVVRTADDVPCLKSVICKFKSNDYVLYAHPSEVKGLEFIHQTPFSTNQKVDLRVCRGVGNPRISYPGELYATCVSQGSMNRHLYNANLVDTRSIETTRCVNFTWQSYVTMKTLSNII